MKNFINVILAKIKQFDKRLNEYSASSSASIPYLAYANWGINLSQNEDLDKALEKLETSALMQPKSPIVQLNLGQVKMKKGLYSDALQNFFKTIRMDNTNAVAYSLIASCYILQDEFKDAENYYKKACKLAPDNTDVRTNFATALAQKGKKYRALEIYKDALKIDHQDFLALHYTGLILCDLGKFDEALENLEQANAIKPDNPITLLYMGLCKYRLDRAAEALEDVERSISLKPNFSDSIMVKGVCLAKLGKEAECLMCFSAHAKGNETNAQFYTYWGIALQTFERYAEAKEKFLQSFELDRDNELNLFYFAENYMKDGNLTPALQLYQKIVDINGNNGEAYEKIGDILYKQADYKGSMLAYFNCIKVSRKHLHLYCNIAKCYYNLDNFKECANYYAKAIDYNPDLIEAYIGYVELLIQLGNYKEALRKIRTAYKKAPDSFEINNLYSQILVKEEMYQDAIEKLDKLIQINPQYYEAILTKAEVLNALKKPQEAIGLLQTLPKEYYDTRDFLYISTISYDNLAQLSPSHYNISKALEYCDRLTDKYSTEYKLDGIRQRLEETLKTVEGE
ncbi:MAG: tetratricopeptide repeat protein [Candidatus Gastranaerophilales bacterium]|nr:tetratricopeptide repeat protein [Candidatus Gastranaerophilales bacterium]